MAGRSGKWRKVYKPCDEKGCGRPKADSSKNPHNHTTYIQRPIKRKK